MKLVGDRAEFKARIDFGFDAHQLPSLRKEIDHSLEIGHAPLGQIAAGINSTAILNAFALSFCARRTFSHGIYTPPIESLPIGGLPPQALSCFVNIHGLNLCRQ